MNVVTFRVYNGETINLLLNIQYYINGVSHLRSGVSGESPVVSIKRLSDNKYWNGSAWQISAFSNSMSEYDSTNFPGLYRYIFEVDSNNTYIVRYINTGVYSLDNYELYVSGDYNPIIISDLKTEFSNVRRYFKNFENLLTQLRARIVDVEKRVSIPKYYGSK